MKLIFSDGSTIDRTFGTSLVGVSINNERPIDILVSAREIVKVTGVKDPNIIAEYILKHVCSSLSKEGEYLWQQSTVLTLPSPKCPRQNGRI